MAITVFLNHLVFCDICKLRPNQFRLSYHFVAVVKIMGFADGINQDQTAQNVLSDLGFMLSAR